MLKQIAELVNAYKIDKVRDFGFTRVEYVSGDYDHTAVWAEVKRVNTLMLPICDMNRIVSDEYNLYWVIKNDVHINIKVPKCPECDNEIYGGHCVCKTSEVV